MKKTILLLFLICEVGFSQQIIFMGSDGKLYHRTTTGTNSFVDSAYTVTATATVDTSESRQLQHYP